MGPINIGNPNEMTIMELADLVKELMGGKVSLIYANLPIDDPKQRKPDIARAWAQLGWMPEVDLREGLEKTISYFREAL